MAGTVKRQFRVTFPQHLANQPVVFQMANEHDLIPTVRRAHLDAEGGEILLELEGKGPNLERAVEYLRSRGMTVAPADQETGV